MQKAEGEMLMAFLAKTKTNCQFNFSSFKNVQCINWSETNIKFSCKIFNFRTRRDP